MTENAPEKQIELFIPAAVDFKVFEQEQELFKMVNGQAAIYRPERMRQGMGNIFLLEIATIE